MYLIVRTSALPSLAQQRARVRPPVPIPLGRPLGRPLVAADHDDDGRQRDLDRDDLVGCCGCVAPGELAQQVPPLPRMPEPMAAAAPPPFSPEPEDRRLAAELDAVGWRWLVRRVQTLEAHVDALDGALARRDAAERAERERDEALERAEDRVFGALVELLSSAWDRWREERRRLGRRR